MKIQPRIVVIITSAVLLLIFCLLIFSHNDQENQPIPLYTSGQPTIGNPLAKVHVIAFEDPKCNNCLIYHREFYQSLYNDFIATNKIRYTIYLVSELPLSSTISNMLFCVNQQSPQAFFTFLNYYFQNPPLALTEEELNTELMRIAKGSNLGIQLNLVETCVENKGFERQVAENTNYAKAIMGGVIKTPTIFVNGIRLLRPSYEDLKKLIELELKKGS